MTDEIKMTTVPLNGYIRLEQQRDVYREALERIVAIKGRGRFDGSMCRTGAEQDVEEMVRIAAAALQRAMEFDCKEVSHMEVTPVVCGNCGSDEELILVHHIVGQIVIGARPDGSVVPDGGPEYYDPTESQARQHVWCGACCEMTTPQPASSGARS